MTYPSIVLIEDSERYIAELLLLMEKDLHIKAEQVRVLRTETEFHTLLPKLEVETPGLFIIDIMLPYKAFGESDAAVPAEIKARAKMHRFYRAGIRCANAILGNKVLSQVPVILHSILEKEDIDSDKEYPIPSAPTVTVCKKEANGHGIIQAAEQVLGRLAG